MLTFAKALTRTAITYAKSYPRSARLWPVLLALLTSFHGQTARAEPVAISPEGVRASAVDIAYDADGSAWLLWVQKGARIPGAGHASAGDLYLTRWPTDASPRAPVKVNADTCLLYTSPSPRDLSTSRMPSSA